MNSPFLSQRAPVCPPELLAQAQACAKPRVAIARAGAELPMQAAKAAVEAGIMAPIFVGERDLIEVEASKLDWDISDFEIVETFGENEAGEVAAAICGAGDADVLMKGDLHSDVFMHTAVARKAKLRTKTRLVHVFHLTHPDGGKPLLVSDGAVNVLPRMNARKASIMNCVKLLHLLGNERPKVAILSATETPISAIPSSLQARELFEWAHENVEGADFSGPLALDLALSPNSVEVKGLVGDPVAGQADALIVPDIVSGNILFKSLVYLQGACAAGIVMGMRAPLLLTSRADPPAARLASVALAAIVCGAK